MTLYAVTIFLSAFLLFQVQPLIAKMILPWFGGSAAVWSASMLFFQLLLLAGYAYAHVSIRFLKPRMQMLVHEFGRSASEWRVAGKHVPERYAKGVQIRADVHANPCELLRAGKLGCPGKAPRH